MAKSPRAVSKETERNLENMLHALACSILNYEPMMRIGILILQCQNRGVTNEQMRMFLLGTLKTCFKRALRSSVARELEERFKQAREIGFREAEIASLYGASHPPHEPISLRPFQSSRQA